MSQLLSIFMAVIVIFTNAVSARIILKSWMAPGAFLSIIWVFATVIPLLFTIDKQTSSIGVWVITMFLMLFNFGCFVASRKHVLINKKYLEDVKINYPFLKEMVLLMSICGFIASAVMIILVGGNLQSILSLDTLSNISTQSAANRYEGMDDPLYVKILLYPSYIGTIMGGLLFSISSNKPGKYIAILPLLSSLLYSTVTTAKASFLLGLVLWLSSFITTRVSDFRKPFVLFSKKKILSYILALIFGNVLIIFIAIMRTGSNDITDVSIAEKIFQETSTTYFAAHIFLFSEWISKEFSSYSLSFGAYTFAGIFSLLGVATRQQGLFETSSLEINSNVYTVFRGMIMDYGIIGSMLIMFFGGFIATKTFVQLAGKEARKSIALMPVFYLFILWSPIASPFVYTSILLAVVFYWAYVILVCY
jgi:oligosaccharide repeat unit polymerase